MSIAQVHQIVRPKYDDVTTFIAKVAVARIEQEMHETPGRKPLFSIVDLSRELTSAIAHEAAERIRGAEIYISEALSDGTLSPEMELRTSATYIRNKEKTDGEGAIIFAVTTSHLDVVGATVKEIKQISEEALAQAPDLWLSSCPELKLLSPRAQEGIAEFIRGAYKAGIVTGGLPMLAGFVLKLDEECRKTINLAQALDNALPAFRIPAGAGRFREFGQRGRLKSADSWAVSLGEIFRKAEDALQLRNDRGSPLDRIRLRNHLEALFNDGRIKQDDYDVLKELLDDETLEAGKWRPTQEAVVTKVRWEVLEQILKLSKATQKDNLGTATLQFFAEQHPGTLSKGEEDLLKNGIVETADAEEAEREFFFNHRARLRDNKRLLKRWEAFIFRKTEEHADLLSGIFAAAADLIGFADPMPEDPMLVIRLEGADRPSYFKGKKIEICRFLRDRFRGLPQMLGTVVKCDFGVLWSHSEHWDDRKSDEKTSIGARQFKFDICLVSRGQADAEDVFKTARHTTQLLWTMPTNSFANSFSENMREIAGTDDELAHLGSGTFSRPQRSERAVDGIVDLQNRASVQDVNDQSNGILADRNNRHLDQGRKFLEELERLSGNALQPSDAEQIGETFWAFHVSYTKAVRAFVSDDGQGVCEEAIFEQSKLYGELLRLLRERAWNDECRRSLWTPILSIGMAYSEDHPLVAISCPWHPFRLAEARAKALRVKEALSKLLDLDSHRPDTDIGTYARSVIEDIVKPWHPSIALFSRSSKSQLLIETNEFAGYTLLESPTFDEGADEAFEGHAKEASRALLSLAQEYLDLNPHERSNFSVVLYNADNRELPSKLVDLLARKLENESDLRCDLILTHTKPDRLRQIYAEQNLVIGRELDGALASEAAQTFLSRLRVGFLDVDSVGRGASSRKADILLLDDVIARGSRAAWRRVQKPENGWPTFEGHRPGKETRMLSQTVGERKTETLLVPASRPEEVQWYIDLIHDLHRNEKGDVLGHYVPVREVDFDDENISDAIRQAHEVAEWVVTFDAIANKQLFLSNDVKVIRDIPWAGSPHNLIVSTKKASKMLKANVAEQLFSIIGKPAEALAEKCIDSAASISGRVVLRAARQENNALELIGLMLSKEVLMASLPEGFQPIAWFQIDDFAEAIGLKSRRKADILALCAGEEDGVSVLDMYVVESKFIERNGFEAEKKRSFEQATETTSDLRDRIVLENDVLNRGYWRSRLADLLIEHREFWRHVSDRDPKTWTDMLRSDDANIRIRGMSFVFVHDSIEMKLEPCDPDPKNPETRQYAFDRAAVGRIFRVFESPGSETPLSIQLPEPAFCGKPPAGLNAGAHESTGPDAGPLPETTVETPSPVAESGPSATEPSAPPVADACHPASSAAEEAVREGVAGKYPKPVLEYIENFNEVSESGKDNAWLEDIKPKLRFALRSYGMETEITGDRLTPNSALIMFRGNDTLTVANVERRREVLQTSHGIVVTDVRPGIGEVIVVVRRPKRAILSLPELWRRRQLPDTAPELNGSFLIGEREDNGELLYLNIFSVNGDQPEHGPHTLIAGETGGGKGILTRNILLDMLATNSPRNLRIRFVDPKRGADYRWLEKMPHLDGGIVSTQEEAIATLQELVQEMESRYDKITATAPDIDAYNDQVDPSARLPRIFLFHDEVGDWMADKSSGYPDAVSNYVVRLASKARAAGVHLVLITQRPDKDAMPSQVKANVGNKICLRVSSGINSRIVLDEIGAEKLFGKGHFAAKLANEIPMGQSSLIFGQVPYLDYKEAWKLAGEIADYWKGAG